MNVLVLYKNLLRQCKYIYENDKKLQFINRIKSEFKNNKTANQEFINDLIKKGENHLSFLKSITPKIPKSHSEGNKKYIMKDGKLEEIEHLQKSSKALSNFTAGNIDPDQLRRHQYLVDRQHFKAGPLKDYPKNVWKK